MLLITTSDKRSWDSAGQLAFLGNWCFAANEAPVGGAIVIPYHWNDRSKFRGDYVHIVAAYEAALKDIAAALNTYHGTGHSLRYWRILLGPWLYVFVSILFDRWEMIASAAAQIDDPETICLSDPEHELIPRDLRGLNPDNPRWNHFIYACAIRSHGGFSVRELPGASMGCVPDSATVKPPQGLHETLRNQVRKLMNALVRPGEAFLIASYLPRRTLIALQLRLGQLPKFWRSPPVPQIAPAATARTQFSELMSAPKKDSFSTFLWQMIPRQIPTIYLEGFPTLSKCVSDLPWPCRPRAIFTSNAYQFDEVFQAWAATQTEQGVPLVVGQHGGFFGMGEIVAGEEHQVAIADRFLTWGWSDGRASVYPFSALTTLGKGEAEWSRNGNLLLVTVPIRRVGFKCNSWAMGPEQSWSFLRDQQKFAALLKPAVRKTVVLRIHKGTDDKLGTGYIPSWQQEFPDVEIDPSVTPIEERIRAARVFVYTYNSTGYLETLARNIPTVIFWNPEHWELRAAAKPYFALLETAGIFHSDPAAAAAHVNAVWDSVDSWWKSPSVQAARKTFCAVYARESRHPVEDLLAALSFEPEKPATTG